MPQGGDSDLRFLRSFRQALQRDVSTSRPPTKRWVKSSEWWTAWSSESCKNRARLLQMWCNYLERTGHCCTFVWCSVLTIDHFYERRRECTTSCAGRSNSRASCLRRHGGCLRSGDHEIELRPKTFEVLKYLIENAD